MSMKYFNIVYRILVVISLIILALAAQRIDKDSAEIYEDYKKVYGVLIEQPCYNELQEAVKIDFEKVSNKTMYHDARANKNFFIVFMFAGIFLITSLVITILEILRINK
jgi:hypothetical protein